MNISRKFFSKKAILAITTGLLTACEQSTGGGGCEPIYSLYSIDKYTVDFVAYTTAENTSYEEHSPYQATETVTPSNFAFQLKSNHTGTWLSKRMQSISLFPKAYACSPAQSFIAEQRIVDFKVISDASFGEAFPAGTDLEAFFIPRSIQGATPHSMMKYLGTPISAEQLPPISAEFRLVPEPPEPQHTFTITIELDDGAVYEFESPLVTFDLSGN